jgi:hypothetical protein
METSMPRFVNYGLPNKRRRLRGAFSLILGTILFSLPAFAQVGTDRVTQFLSNALSYAQSLGIFGAGFLVIWAVANIARERPSGKQWAGAGGALLLSSLLQLLRTFAG